MQADSPIVASIVPDATLPDNPNPPRNHCVEGDIPLFDTAHLTQQRLIQAYENLGLNDRADRVRSCMQFRPAVCSNGHEPAVRVPCRDSLCPACTPRGLWVFVSAGLYPDRTEGAAELRRLWQHGGAVYRLEVRLPVPDPSDCASVLRHAKGEALRRARKLHMALGSPGGFRAMHFEVRDKVCSAVVFLAIRPMARQATTKVPVGARLIATCDSFRDLSEFLRKNSPNSVVPIADSDEALAAATQALRGFRRTGIYEAAQGDASEMREAVRQLRTPLRCPVCHAAVRIDPAGPQPGEELDLVEDDGLEYLSFVIPASRTLPPQWRTTLRRVWPIPDSAA